MSRSKLGNVLMGLLLAEVLEDIVKEKEESKAPTLEDLLKDIMKADKFMEKMNQQTRSLILKSGLFTEEELPLKGNGAKAIAGMKKFKEHGFKICQEDICEGDSIYMLTHGNGEDLVPKFAFLSITDGNKQMITKIFEIKDGNVEKAIEDFFEV